MRLVVGREPVIADAVQVAQARTQAARKVLRLHPVHHVHAGLPVLGGGDQDQVLTQRVLRVAHQHALVAGLRKGSAELPFRHEDGVTLHTGHLHPVAFQVSAGKGLAAHQVMGSERVILLESDLPVSVFQYGGLYLTIGGADTKLAAHAAHLLDKQLQYYHDLAYRQLVDGKMGQSVLHPQPPPLTEKTVHEFRAAKELTHDKGQQLGIALVINTRIILLSERGSRFEGDLPLCTVILFFADVFRLTSPRGKKIVVRRQCLVPATDNVRKRGTLRL